MYPGHLLAELIEGNIRSGRDNGRSLVRREGVERPSHPIHRRYELDNTHNEQRNSDSVVCIRMAHNIPRFLVGGQDQRINGWVLYREQDPRKDLETVDPGKLARRTDADGLRAKAEIVDLVCVGGVERPEELGPGVCAAYTEITNAQQSIFIGGLIVGCSDCMKLVHVHSYIAHKTHASD